MKAAAAAVFLVGLLVVVAFAARGSHPGGHGRIAQRRVPDQVNNDLVTIIIVLYFAGVVGLIIGFILFRSKWQRVESHWVRDTLLTVLVFSLLAVIGQKLLGSRSLHNAAERARKQQQQGSGGARPGKPRQLKRVTSGGAHFDWALAIGLLGLLVVGSAVYYVRARGNPIHEPLDVQDDVKDDLSLAVSDAIDDLRSEPDARRAVIAAYARMEGVLARHGHARRPAETPFEYLSRILLSLHVRGAAVEELTELFERAKFSRHPIDELMKERAISALVSIREDLQPAVAA